MSPLQIIGMVLVGLAGLLLGFTIWGLRARALRAENARLSTNVTTINQEQHAAAAKHRETQLLLEDLTAQLERTVRERNDFRRREEERRLSIEGILKERDNAWALYDDQAISHGNAQVLMMSGLAYLHRKLAEHGIQVEMPSIIQETHELYVQGHVEPVLARRSDIVRVHKDIPGQPALTEKT